MKRSTKFPARARKQFAVEVRQLLRKYCFSPEEAAVHLEVSSRSVYRWVTGESVPSKLMRWAIRNRLASVENAPE